MARIIFTTCGTSVLSSACWKLEKVSLKSLCSAEGADLRNKQAWNEAKILAFKDDHQSAQQLADTVDPELLKEENIGRIRDLPAEVASLMALNYLLKQRETPNPLQGADRIILLHSTDPTGKYCAEVVKRVLDTYLQENNAIVKPEAIGDVDPGDFRTSMGKMSEKCKAIIQGNPGYEFIFNLTGGYKAMGITVSALGTSLHGQANIRVCYLHETTDYSKISTGFFSRDGIEWIDWDMFRAYSRVGDVFES